MNEIAVSLDVIIKNKNVVVSSLSVAKAFGKRHDNVLQTIDNIKRDWDSLIQSKNGVNRNIIPLKSQGNKQVVFTDYFKEGTYISENGRLVKFFEMNRNGFMLLTNSFNGKRILPIKLAFIERFDELEHIAIEQVKETEKRKDLNQAIKESPHFKPFYYSRFSDFLCQLMTHNKYKTVKKLREDKGFYGKQYSKIPLKSLLDSEEDLKRLQKLENSIIAWLELDYSFREIKEFLTKENRTTTTEAD
ncbi:Rha family transcriptional regulator [Lactococcus garvieae]|uniref:Rha family transcriptional regulator n=1 Tax=Lactococcus garvieae TaxID=1363 RepID=UPI003D16546B